MSIVEKLIPALPANLRVAAMRQLEDVGEAAGSVGEATVLEYVCRSDLWRNRLERELAGLC